MKNKTNEDIVKHTQGKWTVELHDAEGTYTILEAQERLGALNTDSEENRKEIHSEDLANANLIAAAPELLEVCKRTAELIVDSYNEDPTLIAMAIGMEDKIAKAESK